MTAPGHSGPLGRRAVWSVAASVMAASLAVFVLVERLDIGVLTDPDLDRSAVLAASLALALLTVDAILPVPSSVVMISLGASFGVVGGTVLATVGSVAGFALGFALGRRARSRLDPVGGPGPTLLLRRWGALAIVVSRPLPLLAETVAITAGAFGMRSSRALGSATVGSAVPAALFAWAGARGLGGVNRVALFIVVVVVGCGCWALGRWLDARLSATATLDCVKD
jgi:uncharacterized membrane protein YdjX (TVP38/TMEM64 family)